MAYTPTSVAKIASELLKGRETFSENGQTYSADDAETIIRQSLNEAWEGSTKYSRKIYRRNKTEIHELTEVLVDTIIHGGFKGSEFWNKFVTYHMADEGEQVSIVLPKKSLFAVAEVADGYAVPRRQRIGKATRVTIPTVKYSVRIYEEFELFRTGQIDWVELVRRVGDSFAQKANSVIYTAFSGISSGTTGVNSNLLYSGTWVESKAVELASKIEAATGKRPVFWGTAPALALMVSSVVSDSAKDNMFNSGYYGKFRGYDMMQVGNVLKPGTDTFELSDSVIHISAGDSKMIHFVEEGDAEMSDKDETENGDQSIEYLMAKRFGALVACPDYSYARMTISAG